MDNGFTDPGEEFAVYAEESMGHARRAVDGLMRAAVKSSDTVEESRTVVGEGLLDLHRKAMAIAEANVEAGFDHAAALAAARGPGEVWLLNRDFALARLAASYDHSLALARSAGELATRLGTHWRERL